MSFAGLWDAQEPEDGLDGRELLRGRRAASGRLGDDTAGGGSPVRVQEVVLSGILQRIVSRVNFAYLVVKF